MVFLRQTNPWRYEVRLSEPANSRIVGLFETLEDGYFYFYFPDILTAGCLPAHILREIAEKLDEINEPWDKIVEQGLEKGPSHLGHPDNHPFS